jgi:thymidine phosphorylase
LNNPSQDAARIVALLREKRDGNLLSDDDYRFLITGITDGSVSDAQVGAFVMAVFTRGLSLAESATLTRAMADSGWRGQWDLDGPVLDKHSTGGLGDIVSFLLAPMVAACGGYVPMITGRSLGHTGGTVDKLESIPGYDPFPDPQRFQQIVAKHGLAIVGQTADMVPADQRLYATRDHTGTVESLPLIAASILSKKLAEGLDGLVIDLKVGSGAFMLDESQGRPLADTLEGVADATGMACKVMFSDMNQPLIDCVGDALEMHEAVKFLAGGKRQERLHEVTMTLATELLVLGDLATDLESARSHLQTVLESGAAAEKFQSMVSTLGGPADLLDRPEKHFPAPEIVRPISADRTGIVTAINGRLVGNTLHETASRPGKISFDHAIGLSDLVQLGDRVEPGQPLASLQVRTEQQFQRLADGLVQAIKISEH